MGAQARTFTADVEQLYFVDDAQHGRCVIARILLTNPDSGIVEVELLWRNGNDPFQSAGANFGFAELDPNTNLPLRREFWMYPSFDWQTGTDYKAKAIIQYPQESAEYQGPASADPCPLSNHFR